MRNWKFLLRRHACWVATLFLFILQPGHDGSATSPNVLSVPAYIQRGLEVQKHFAAYGSRLERYYESLSAEIKRRAPDLLAHLQPPAAMPHGYQILPAITFDTDPGKQPYLSPVAYSWPWTDRLIDIELRGIARSEAELRRARSVDSRLGRIVLEKLALNYQAQSRRRQNIDAHVQYNRLWQAAIAADRAGYDQATALQHQVLERQKIAARLKHLGVNMPVRLDSRPSPPVELREITTGLQTREALLSEHIDQAFNQVNTPDFVRLDNTDHECIIHVPLFTDIADQDFVGKVKRIIETTWRLTVRGRTFRVKLDVAYVAAHTLYGDLDLPIAGQKIDLARHLRHFPSGGAILTTGALTTHVQDYAIILGPHPIPARVLAHEFGHILGFRDRYIRGYRNLGENGFQIMEVIADLEDIMAATPQGVVLPAHFASLVKGGTTRIFPAPKPVHADVKRTAA